MVSTCAIFVLFLTFVAGYSINTPQHPASSIVDNYIAGGMDAKEAAVPYQVSLQSNGTHFCGGSIVGDRWILTAAQCLRPGFYVLAGTNDLTKGGSKYAIDRTFSYDPLKTNNTLILNDIALIRLARPLRFSERVKMIQYTAESVPENETLTLTGWGQTGHLENANRLQTMNTFSMDLKNCEEKIGFKLPNNGIMCSFVAERDHGACEGDYGGPVTWKGKQVGIMKISIGCACGRPDLHTHISCYYNWIKTTIANNK